MSSSYTRLTLLSLLSFNSLTSAVTNSSKRGLCFVPNANHLSDNKIWVESGSDIKWYYNYQESSPAYQGLTQEQLEFVPMMWGADTSNLQSTKFLDAVKDQISSGRNITHVLGFNEPDAKSDWGGSDLLPEDAAVAWVANFEPLGKMGLKLGLPACTGGWGSLPWLKQFLGNCSDIVSKGQKDKKNCTWDFLPVHWYDNFEGLASHMGERRREWPGAEIWVTEYALAHADLKDTQAFFRQTLDYFDKEDWVGGYTYFGAFHSYTSNVGPEATFLNNDGKLTAIGNQYLGLSGAGVDPNSGNADNGAANYVMSRVLTIGAGVVGVVFGLL